MDHDREIRPPHVLGHAVAEEGTDQHVGADRRDRGAQSLVVTCMLHGDLVPGRSQLDPGPLGQAIECRAQQHDP
jgi:hypothetical protein